MAYAVYDGEPYQWQADFAAAITTSEGEELQRVLASNDAEERLQLALELLTKEKELAKLQRDINKQVEEKMAKSQREYFLREQLKSIKKVNITVGASLSLFIIILLCNWVARIVNTIGIFTTQTISGATPRIWPSFGWKYTMLYTILYWTAYCVSYSGTWHGERRQRRANG